MCANHVSGLFANSVVGIRNAVAPHLIKTQNHNIAADTESTTTVATTCTGKSYNYDKVLVAKPPPRLASLFLGVPLFIRKRVTNKSNHDSIRVLGGTSGGQSRGDKMDGRG